MLDAPSRTPTFGFRRLAALASTIAAILLCGPLVAFSSEQNEVSDRSNDSLESRRAKKNAYIDLPMRVRVRFEASYTDALYVSDELASPYVSDVGPSVWNDHSLESRVALIRSISDRIEVGIIWGARRPLMNLNLLDFERQSIGAMIRIAP